MFGFYQMMSHYPQAETMLKANLLLSFNDMHRQKYNHF